MVTAGVLVSADFPSGGGVPWSSGAGSSTSQHSLLPECSFPVPARSARRRCRRKQKLVVFLAVFSTAAMDGDSLESSFEDFPSAEESAPIQGQCGAAAAARLRYVLDGGEIQILQDLVVILLFLMGVSVSSRN